MIYNIQTIKEIINAVNHKFKGIKNTNMEINEDYTPIIYISQYYNDIKKYINKKDINIPLLEFEPNSKYSAVYTAKIKFKWDVIPHQILVHGHICSLFKNFGCRINTYGDRIFAIKTHNKDVIVGLYESCVNYDLNIDSKNPTTTIEYIKGMFNKSSKTIYQDTVIIPHITEEKTLLIPNNNDFTVKISDDHKIEPVQCVDHYKFYLNKHGIYVNRLTRNRNNIIARDITEKDHLIDWNKTILWVEYKHIPLFVYVKN